MHQSWRNLLFLHWRTDPAMIGALLPDQLEVDTYEGAAWVGVAPFMIHGIRPPYLPAAPFLSRSHELNVRTYVIHRGIPGVWFFSLDASNPLAVVAARLTYHLPYFHARMRLEGGDGTIRFTSQRRGAGPQPEFAAEWRGTDPISSQPPDSLLFFLTERYCLYARRNQSLYRARIHHRRWSLRDADLRSLKSTMLTAQGIRIGEGDQPIAHAQGDPLDVEVWPPELVAKPAR